jgi:di/tricarboxylate transporter
MDWQIAYTLGIVLLALAAMVRQLAAPDVVLMGALFALAAAGILTPEETFSGFANPAVATIGALFIVSAALRETGALDLSIGRFLARARSLGAGATRLSLPVASLSAFLNNAPIVAMMTPTVIDWSRRNGLSPSRLLIPLSYASILGSIITIIGTSTNLTVAGLIIDAGMRPMTFFELAPVGLPICAVGLLYLILVVPHRLPDRIDPAEGLGERRREYIASMAVRGDCPMVGQSVEEAGLRHLPGLFLVEIDRGGRVITPVAPDEMIRSGDHLVFAGAVSTIVELQRIRGLLPISEAAEPSANDPSHRLAEAVISASSPLVGSSVRDANFRTFYDAAVIAVHRNGERVPGKIGEIVLQPGDTLLLQCAPGFLRAHGNSPDFYLVSEIEEGAPPRHERAWLALGVLAVMVACVTAGLLPIAIASFLAIGALILTRCLTTQQARRSVNWSILIVIGAGLGIAGAMQKTGAAALVADVLVGATGELGPLAALAVIYAASLVMAEMLHHNAAVAIMFPIAVATATRVDADPRGFVMAVAVACCCAFASPVTYQTHLIVYGPGGYRFMDFVRVGLPLDLICGVVAVAAIPWIWPF